MAQIQGGETFAIGQQFTATRANNHVNGATLLPGAVTDQPAITANTVEASDSVILHDDSAGALKEATVGDLLNSGVSGDFENLIVRDSLTLKDTADTTTFVIQAERPNTSDPVSIVIQGRPDTAIPQVIIGDPLVSASDIDNPDVEVRGTLVVNDDAKFLDPVDFATNTSVKLPVGTTAERPASPVQGDIRFNSDTEQAEVYNGTAWEEVGGGPFDATGGNTIIAPDTTVVSGVSFTSVDGYRVTVTHSGHSVHPGQTIEFTTTVAGYSGEFTVYEADATTFKFFMNTIATPNSGTGDYRKAGNFKCHIFTSSGTFVAGPKEGYVELLVVGGGGNGGGGVSLGGGGGGGGFAYVGRYKINANQTILVTVGLATQSSIFGSVTAYAGNNGGSYQGGSSGYTSINPTVYSGVDTYPNPMGGPGGGSSSPAIWPGGYSDPTNISVGNGHTSQIMGVDVFASFGGNGGRALASYPPGTIYGKGGDKGQPGNAGIVIVRYPYWI